MRLDFTLSYTQNQWLCYNDEVKILVDTLDELDDKWLIDRDPQKL